MTKKLLAFLSAFCIVSVLFSIGAAADTGAVIKFSKSTVSVGEQVTVTVTVRGTELTGTDFKVSYNNDVLTYQSGATQGGAGVLDIVDSEFNAAGIKTKSYSIVFTAAKAGSCAISVSGSASDGVPAKDVAIGSSASMVVKDVTLSSNAKLKSLSLSNGSLSPSFSAGTYSYTARVANGVSTCKVYAVSADADAKVSVSGDSALSVGSNKRTVTVTAPSGAQQTYTITITRDKAVDSSTQSNTSSAETASGPLSADINGTTFTVATDLSAVKLPAGFLTEKVAYNGNEVTVAYDAERNFVLYYLKAPTGDALLPYTYDAETKVFSQVKLFSQGNNQYILTDFPDDYIAPSEYYAVSTEIGGYSVKCYANIASDMSDLYYVNCFVNGKYAIYRYDSVDGVLQRSPDFELGLSSTDETSSSISVAGKGLISRFGKLSSNAKTIVVCAALFVLGIIALIVLLVVRYVSCQRLKGFANTATNGFDNISETDGFIIQDPMPGNAPSPANKTDRTGPDEKNNSPK